ncbi:hypothetical protein NN561_004321 [Cricetulus griseus]
MQVEALALECGRKEKEDWELQDTDGLSVEATEYRDVEWVPTSMRAISSTSIGYCYTFGQFILSGLAYAIPQWRWLQLTTSVPFFIFSLLSWWVPESIRWLVLSGKFSKALKTLQRVATFNGKKEEGENITIEELKFSLQKDIDSVKIKYGLSDLFRVSILRRVTFCLSLACLAMGVEEFGVNIYILQIIFGGVDIPAKFITIVSISYLGRRITQGFLLLLAGGAILGINLVPSGMGISNSWARVGSMIAPLVKITGEVQPYIPNVIFGTTAILGGSAAFFLLETLNRPLPETIEDLEDWHQQVKKSKQEPEAEKSLQTIPLKTGGLDPS